MKLRELDQATTAVPLEACAPALGGSAELAVLPAADLEQGTAVLLVAKQGQLWIVSRADGGGAMAPPSVAVHSVEWHAVGIGPLGVVGRVPGGLLGGPEATDHIVMVMAGDHLYEARLHGSDGMEAVEEFASTALHAGARDFEP